MSRKNKGEVWFAKFQFEEIEGFKYRPVVVLDDGNFDAIKVLVVKVTTKNRNIDTDVPILYWGCIINGVDRRNFYQYHFFNKKS